MKLVYIVTITADPTFTPSLREMTDAITESLFDNFGIEDGVEVEEDEI